MTTPTRFYIITGTRRSGSSLLCDLLNMTRVAGAPQEFLAHLLRPKWLRDWGLPATCTAEQFWQASLENRTTENGLHGVKVFYDHLFVFPLADLALARQVASPEHILAALYPGAQYIHIQRRDLRGQALSLFRAIETDAWWAAAPSFTPLEPPPHETTVPTLDAKKVLRCELAVVQNNRAWKRYYARHSIQPLIVEYEQLVADMSFQLGRVLQFLGLDPSLAYQIPPPRVRQQRDSHTEQWRQEVARLEPQFLAPAATSQRDIIVAENFYAEPDAVRQYALRQTYYCPYEDICEVQTGRVRCTWWASRFQAFDQCLFKSSPLLRSALERLTGEEIDLEHWMLPYPVDEDARPIVNSERPWPTRSALWNCAFHIKPEIGQTLGTGVHSHTDHDRWNAVGEQGWAGVIYLNPDAPLDGGLHLWRNRDPTRQADWMTDAANWEQVDRLGNVYNRLILCRGRLPHSGANGWGTSLQNGRLFQTFFWRTKKSGGRHGPSA